MSRCTCYPEQHQDLAVTGYPAPFYSPLMGFFGEEPGDIQLQLLRGLSANGPSFSTSVMQPTPPGQILKND